MLYSKILIIQYCIFGKLHKKQNYLNDIQCIYHTSTVLCVSLPTVSSER